MSQLEHGSDAEMNPNNSLDGEDITAGLKELRLPSRVSSTSSSRVPSVKSPVLPQGLFPAPAQVSTPESPKKNRLEELLNYVGENDWADDMPDFDSSRESSFISLDRPLPDWPTPNTNKEINNPKLREKAKPKGDLPKGPKAKKDKKKNGGLSADAMRLMPVAGWKPEPVDFSDDDEVTNQEHYQEQTHNSQQTHKHLPKKEHQRVEHKVSHELPTPPNSRSGLSSSRWANAPEIPTEPAVMKSRKAAPKAVMKEKPKLHARAEPVVAPAPAKDKEEPEEVSKTVHIHYSEGPKREKPKEIVIKSRWA